MERSRRGGKVVWSGMTRNRTTVAVKDVEIHCDCFNSKGIWGGAEVGKLTGDARTIDAGKSAYFNVEFDLTRGMVFTNVVARAMGKRY